METKKIFRSSLIVVLLFTVISCSKDEEPEMINEPIVQNAKPIMANQQFDISESIGGSRTIATIEASDPDGDRLHFKLESDIDLVVNPASGAIRTSKISILDYETAKSLSFDVSVRDTKGATTRATVTINIIDEDDGPLTNYQKSFVNEYIYLTYKLSPSASGGALSEKWQDAIKIYMEGDLPNNYSQTVNDYLDEFRSLFTDGTTIELVSSREESNVHLIIGPTSVVANVWPDMYSLINGQGFGGYALYNTEVDYHIFSGRIWMGSASEALFKHELGHIIGLGHTSNRYCEDEVTSVMCPAAAPQFNTFDREIIKILYHPNTPVGLTQTDMRELVTEYLVNGDISLKTTRPIRIVKQSLACGTRF